MNRFDGITKLLGVRLRIGRAVPRRRCLQRPKSTVTMGFRRKFKNCTVKPAQTLGRPSPPPRSSPAQSYIFPPATLLSDRRRVPMHSAPVTNPEASLGRRVFSFDPWFGFGLVS